MASAVQGLIMSEFERLQITSHLHLGLEELYFFGIHVEALRNMFCDLCVVHFQVQRFNKTRVVRVVFVTKPRLHLILKVPEKKIQGKILFEKTNLLIKFN